MKNRIVSIILILFMMTAFVVTPVAGRPTTVKKAIPVQQQTTAKVVGANSDGNSNAVVVLPPGFEHRDVVVADSAEYKALLANNKQLQDQVNAEKDWEAKYIGETNQVIQDQANALAAEKKKTHSFFSFFGIFKWIMGGGFVVVIVGTIVLCVFFPAVAPLVFEFVENWTVSAIRSLIKIVKDFATVISNLRTKKS